ncbi:acyl-CoA dehydrogenase [soil metagenome]
MKAPQSRDGRRQLIEVVIVTAVHITVSARPDAGRVETLLAQLSRDAAPARADMTRALSLASTWGRRLPLPGRGDTATLWAALATLASIDLQVARAVEPHLDALSILDECDAGVVDETATWGVFAAEGAGLRLDATQVDGGTDGAGWTLSGTKPWCSLASRLTHALVTAHVGDGRGLFAVDLRHPGVTCGTGPWVARGLPSVRSTSIDLEQVPATPVGEPGWYLGRDGFAWGGMGVAAIWYGGAVGVARRLARQAQERELDQVGHLHLGAVDVALHRSRAVLAEAAAAIDSGRAAGEVGAQLALQVRAVVADTVEDVLRHTEHALGPAPLVAEEEHAGRVADLHLYLRQHHAERDVAALGRRIAGQPSW